MKKALNKKAMVVENMSELGIAIVIVLIAFILLSLAAKMQSNAKLENSKDELARALLDNEVALYLKQPVNNVEGFRGKEFNMAEFTVLAAENQGLYGDDWKKRTDDFFTKNNFKMEYYELKVCLTEAKCISSGNEPGFIAKLLSGGGGITAESSVVYSNVILPSYSGTTIKLTMRAVLSTKFYQAKQPV